MIRSPLFDDLVMNTQASQRQDRQAHGQNRSPHGMVTASLVHPRALWASPVLSPGKEFDVRPFPPGGQMPILRLAVPEGCPFCQPQFSSTTPGLLLLAGQPVPQGGHQVIVGQLVVFLTWLSL